MNLAGRHEQVFSILITSHVELCSSRSHPSSTVARVLQLAAVFQPALKREKRACEGFSPAIMPTLTIIKILKYQIY